MNAKESKSLGVGSNGLLSMTITVTREYSLKPVLEQVYSTQIQS